MHVAEYTYQLHKGHPVVNLGGKGYLFATGAQRSVGNSPILLHRRDIDPKPSHQGVTVAGLRQRFGKELAGMIGCDLLSPFTVNFYPEDRLVRFSEAKVRGGITLPLSTINGVPVVEIEVSGRRLSMLLDTASAVTLLPEAVVRHSELQGRNLAFHPLAGTFHTHHYTMEVCIGDACRLFRVGIVPEALDYVLGPDNIDGVLGVDVLQHFGLCLSIGERFVKLGRRSVSPARQRRQAPLAQQAM